LLARLVLSLLLAAAAPAGSAGGLEEVPRSDLAALSEESREQLLEARERLDAALGASSADGSELGALFGRMGQLYYLYELFVPAGACFENARRLQPGDYRWPYFLGAIATARGEVDRAVELLSEAEALAPEDTATHLRLGRLYLDRDELPAAEGHLARALELDSESAAAHEGLGRIAGARGDHATALAHFSEALRLQPTATSLHHSLGMIYRELGDLDLARSHLQQNRHHPVVMRDPLVNQLALEGRGPRRYLEVGQEALERGNYETAATAFRQVVARSPEDPRGRYNLALALAGQGKVAEGIEQLRVALDLDPDYGDALFNLGALLALGGRFGEAAAAYERLSRLEPEDGSVSVQWAAALRDAGRLEDAAAVVGDLLQRQPDHPRGLLLSAALLQARDETAEAARRLEQALRVATAEEDRVEAEMALGDIARAEGRMAEALERFSRARAAAPRNPRAVTGFAFLSGAVGRYAEAAEAFAVLVGLTPGDPGAHFGRAMALLLAGECATAVGTLGEATSRMPRNLALAHLLARVLATCPDPVSRDGRRALELALAVHESAPSVDHTETVAMAWAEVGDFERAIEWQERAIAQVEAEGGEPPAGAARRRLESYRAGEPVRSPWMPGGRGP
jgi:tetratricopeptide (TPR) repeat protein